MENRFSDHWVWSRGSVLHLRQWDVISCLELPLREIVVETLDGSRGIDFGSNTRGTRRGI